MFCINCGASFPKGINFCPNCGRVVSGPVASVQASVPAAQLEKKRRPFLTFGLVVLTILIAAGSYAVQVTTDAARHDLLILVINIFDFLVLLFLVATIVYLIFLAFKKLIQKYVLPKLRHARGGHSKILSALQRKFTRHKR